MRKTYEQTHISRKIKKIELVVVFFMKYQNTAYFKAHLQNKTKYNTQNNKTKNMVRLIPSYFTEQIILKIRNHSEDVNWMEYRKYHSQYEKITSRNAIYIMTEFNNICETIATFPKEYFNIVFVDRLLEKYN